MRGFGNCAVVRIEQEAVRDLVISRLKAKGYDVRFEVLSGEKYLVCCGGVLYTFRTFPGALPYVPRHMRGKMTNCGYDIGVFSILTNINKDHE